MMAIPQEWLYSLLSPPPSSLATTFFGFLTAVLAAGAAAAFLSPSGRGRGGPARLAPGRGAGFLARLGSAGASGGGAAAAASAAAAPSASPLGTISPLYTQHLMPITP